MKSAQHRPFLTPIWLTVGAFGLAFLFAVFLLWVLVTADATTVIVIVAPDDSSAGQARAAALSKMFGAARGPARLDAIYWASPGPGAEQVPSLKSYALATSKDEPRELARRVLRERSGGRVLIVGTAATEAEIVQALSGKSADEVGKGDVDALFIVTVPRIGHANILRLSY